MEVFHHFFSNLYKFDELIRWGGYTVMFIIVFSETGLLAGFFLPGDSLLVTAGLVAATGYGKIQIHVLISLLSVAAILGDTVGYWFGYHIGQRIFTKGNSLFFKKDHLRHAQNFYEKYGSKTIVLARFVPIVRTFAPTLAGVGRMRYRRFFVYNVAGGLAWVLSMTLIGYFLGNTIPNIEKQIHWVIVIVILISFLPLVNEWSNYRKLKRQKNASGQVE